MARAQFKKEATSFVFQGGNEACQLDGHKRVLFLRSQWPLNYAVQELAGARYSRSSRCARIAIAGGVAHI